MASVNKAILVGNVTRDPEARTFTNGGKVVKFGIALNRKFKNKTTGQWEEKATFLDIEAFNRGENGKLADTCEQYVKKGMQVYIDGEIRIDHWTNQEGQKREKIVIEANMVQFLGSKRDTDNGINEPPPSRQAAPATSGQHYANAPEYTSPPNSGTDSEIPFAWLLPLLIGLSSTLWC